MKSIVNTQKTDGKIVVSRTNDTSITAGTYNSGEEYETVITQSEYDMFVLNYGKKAYLNMKFFDSAQKTNYETVYINMASSTEDTK